MYKLLNVLYSSIYTGEENDISCQNVTGTRTFKPNLMCLLLAYFICQIVMIMLIHSYEMLNLYAYDIECLHLGNGTLGTVFETIKYLLAQRLDALGADC